MAMMSRFMGTKSRQCIKRRDGVTRRLRSAIWSALCRPTASVLAGKLLLGRCNLRGDALARGVDSQDLAIFTQGVRQAAGAPQRRGKVMADVDVLRREPHRLLEMGDGLEKRARIELPHEAEP